MKYYLICPIGGIGGSQSLLTYHSDVGLSVGQIVEIPFGRLSKLGVIISSTEQPNFNTKAVSKKLDEIIPQTHIDLALWISDYYATPLSVTMQALLPRGLNKKRQSEKPIRKLKITRQDSKLPLTREQQKAVNTIESSNSTTHLLHGVTGSGKTRVYRELALKSLAQNKSVLILVPEISLTPQLAAELEKIHDNVLIIHSSLTEAQRHRNWQLLSSSNEPWVVVGPRSALFSPLKSIGLVVVDECHEPSYTQDQQPKYSALRVAHKLASLHSAKLILGSATPTIADYYFAQHTKTPIIELPNAINQEAATISVIDMRDRIKFGLNNLFSKDLLQQMKITLKEHRQILLFHNRRGTARMNLCANCGWTAECRNCHLPLRLHHDVHQLRCHLCGLTEKPPSQCPTCASVEINFKGFGSKRIEQEVHKLFPSAKVMRFDSDNKKGEQLHDNYQALYDGDVDIIIGTQTIAKGLDLPLLDTVGIIQADSELFVADFSSTERAFQLTTQVLGRAGRAGQSSHVFIQTYNPDHIAIAASAKQDYLTLYKHELKERKLEHVTPFTFMLQLQSGYSSAKSAESAAIKIAKQIKNKYPDVNIRGPAPSFHEYRAGKYFQQLVVTSSKRSILTKIASDLPQRWQFTLDPVNLL